MAIKSRAALKALRDISFADNTTGGITPSLLRSFLDDLIDSSGNISNDGASDISTSVSVSSAEILALTTTGKLLVAAPGAGYFIQVVSAAAYYDYGTAAYAQASDIYLNHLISSSAILSDALNINTVTYDIVKQFDIVDQSAGWALTSVENAGIYLWDAATNPTTGDGTLTIYITYRILELP